MMDTSTYRKACVLVTICSLAVFLKSTSAIQIFNDDEQLRGDVFNGVSGSAVGPEMVSPVLTCYTLLIER